MTKHTPAPWKVVGVPVTDKNGKRHPDSMRKVVTSSGGSVMCNGSNKFANAHLIAAAPELLEALNRARYELVTEKFYPETAPVIQVIDAAIAKARGEA